MYILVRLCLPKNCRYRVTVYFRFLHSNLWCCLVDSRHTLSLLHNDRTILVGLGMLNRKKGRHEDMYMLVIVPPGQPVACDARAHLIISFRPTSVFSRTIEMLFCKWCPKKTAEVMFVQPLGCSGAFLN